MTSAALALVLLSQAAMAQSLTLVLQRLETGTELYISAPADHMLDSFGASVEALPMQGAHVDFESFWTGTWGVADAVLAGAEVTIGGQSAGFEGMSFMLHPTSDALPLRTPLDGMIAIGVCNAIDPDARYMTKDLQAYAGYFAQVGSTDSTITLKLPADEILHVTVHDHAPGGASRTTEVELAPGETLRLEPDQPRGLARLFALWR